MVIRLKLQNKSRGADPVSLTHYLKFYPLLKVLSVRLVISISLALTLLASNNYQSFSSD